jgi:Zn-dependent protease
MIGSIPFGVVMGIRLRVHITFLLLLAWVAWEATLEAGWHTGFWTAMVMATVFACVLLHELGHSIVAMRFGVRVHSITLLPIGGVASMGHIPDRPLHEFLVAVAGPMVNVVIGGLLVAIGGVPPFGEMAALPATAGDWLRFVTVANIMLVLFNLVPAFPMDGGRMLRSGLAVFMPYGDATDVAAETGRVIALLFVVLGWMLNPLLPLVGIFVFWGAGMEARSVRVRVALEGKTVADLVRGAPVVLRAGDTLDHCAELFVRHGAADFPVVDDDGRLIGLLPQSRWARLKGNPAETRVGSIMLRRFISIHEKTEATKLYADARYLRQESFPVVRDGVVTGVVRLRDLLAAAEAARPRRRGWFMDAG